MVKVAKEMLITGAVALAWFGCVAVMSVMFWGLLS